MEKSNFTTDEWQFLEWMKRESILSKSKAKRIIDDIDETIVELREKMKNKSRFEKNLIYNQIENRQAQIKMLEKFL